MMQGTPLAVGTELGSFQITALLGKGGMGEVYRARDSKLKREVAIKILPDEFNREAEVLASLNHPNIAAIHDFQEASGSRFLVLELVEGETLADRIARGPIPVEEALEIAKQICEALEAAHEKGIVHRDLKPANIKITPDLKVKVLDFGLAKAFQEQQETNLANSPTLISAASVPGVILGTAAYMSPEQAKGRMVDKRTDIFAFGCVLYEMLTGKRVFDGEDVSEIIAHVLAIDPDWTQLPANVPHSIQKLLRFCLEKNPRNRRDSAADVRIDIEQVAREPESVSVRTVLPRSLWRRSVPVLAAVIIAGSLASLATWNLRRSPSGTVTRFSVFLPEEQSFIRGAGGSVIAIAPDGARLAYQSNGQLYLRSMGEMEARAIPGSNIGVDSPVFSPDGQWIAFYSIQESALKKIPVNGGAAVTVCKAEPSLFGLSWDGDQILFGQIKGIYSVSAEGGEPKLLIEAKPSEILSGPQALNDGKMVLFSDAVGSVSGGALWDRADIIVRTIASGERKVVLKGGSAARYLPAGYLVYAVGNTLLAVSFDVQKLETRGGPVPILEGMARSVTGSALTGGAEFSVSSGGSLAYLPGGGQTALRTLALVDRNGKVSPLGLPPQPYYHPRVSPDGKQIVVGTNDAKESVVWIYDLKGSNPTRRLTFEGRNLSPIWSRDGRYITFASDRDGDTGLFQQPADGSGAAERLTKPEQGAIHRPESWHPYGKLLSYLSSPSSGSVSNLGNVWTLTVDGDRTAKRLVEGSQNERYSVFSPDGKWFVYAVNAGPTDWNVFVQPYPPTGSKYQISTEGGRDPLWSPDGKQLFYNTVVGLTPGKLVAVDIRTQPSFNFGKPTSIPIPTGPVFGGPGRNYDITPDGKQFLVVLPVSGPAADPNARSAPQQINVVLNWFEELKQRVPVK
jgi:serine/threonine-protein kinase